MFLKLDNLNYKNLIDFAQSEQGHYTAIILNVLFVFLILINVSELYFSIHKTSLISLNAPSPYIKKNIYSVHLSEIPTKHIFGEYEAFTPDSLPSSTLTYKLVGTFVASNPKYSFAVINNGEQQTKLVKLHEEIVPGIILKQILNDVIVIDNHGKLEQLTLPKSKILFNSKPKALTL